ncbi:MAG: hypothetical protein ACOX9E_14420, partial [Lentisphaeria bacterium]
SIRRRQPCCGLQARNTAGKQACLVPQNGQEAGACPQCPQCLLYQWLTGYHPQPLRERGNVVNNRFCYILIDSKSGQMRNIHDITGSKKQEL